MTLAPDAFCQDGYFEAYAKYIEDHRQAQAEGHNPELVDFNPPTIDEDGPGDEETMPLESVAATPNGEGN